MKLHFNFSLNFKTKEYDKRSRILFWDGAQS